MKKLSLILFSLLIFFEIQSFGEEKLIFGKAKVIDGDTIKINGEKIRLHGIDSPEIKQVCQNKDNNPYPCGVVAKDFLDNYIFSGRGNSSLLEKAFFGLNWRRPS